MVQQLEVKWPEKRKLKIDVIRPDYYITKLIVDTNTTNMDTMQNAEMFILWLYTGIPGETSSQFRKLLNFDYEKYVLLAKELKVKYNVH